MNIAERAAARTQRPQAGPGPHPVSLRWRAAAQPLRPLSEAEQTAARILALPKWQQRGVALVTADAGAWIQLLTYAVKGALAADDRPYVLRLLQEDDA